MALNDDKKNLPEAQFSPGIRLVPGSGAEKVANAVSGFKQRYQARLDLLNKYMDQQAAIAAAKAVPPTPAPQIKFAGTDPAPDSMFKRPAGAPSAPRTMAQLDAANAAEVAARTRASSASSSPGVGASAAAGRGSASYFIGSNGVRRDIDANGTIFGNPNNAVSVNRPPTGGAATSLARGRTVASTYGLPVTDPRLNEQTAPLARPPLVLREAGAMADQYNAREDREARAKLASDLDSERFRLEMIAGNPGRRGRDALQALSENARQRAALAENAEKLSAEAQQGRTNQANMLAQTALEQQGQDRRAEQDILLRRDTLAADQAGVSQVLNGENGTLALLRRDGSIQAIQNPDGTPFRAQRKESEQPSATDRLNFLRERINGIEKIISDTLTLNPKADVSNLQAQLNALNAQAQDLLTPKRPTAAQIALLKANPDKAPDFDAKFGPGAAALFLGTK